MPDLRTYRLFISHAWDYNDEYYRLIDLLDRAPWFRYANYSVPEHDPLPMRQLHEALYDQIRPVNITIILSGIYVSYSDWIQSEIDIALELDKPIIGIMPWGNIRMPQAVQDVADEIVNWNTGSIVNAIRRYSL
jgi:hypothetical protein